MHIFCSHSHSPINMSETFKKIFSNHYFIIFITHTFRDQSPRSPSWQYTPLLPFISIFLRWPQLSRGDTPQLWYSKSPYPETHLTMDRCSDMAPVFWVASISVHQSYYLYYFCWGVNFVVMKHYYQMMKLLSCHFTSFQECLLTLCFLTPLLQI